MREQLRAGVAIYNDGYYHAAHDAWEDHWLDLESGSDDERLLHGLIQLSGAVYHARDGNWPGAVGLAESARSYLEVLPSTYASVSLEPIQSYLASLTADPELIERRPPVVIAHEGTVPTLETLEVGETAIAAVVLAEELEFAEEPVAKARAYALRDLKEGEDDSRFITLLFDFVREDDHRGLVYQRLSEHVSRQRTREEDVDGLFG
ncbi:DUF309 domain-containing protein [Natronobacterium gregoryi]|uniref:DUF309 domain-containing protein n=2 Tax=Natronobacterium gregoryi TaxID=44930 RepID=L0AF42_NATGS|nr:DUF309 domain-containing protein [Natronobacterium gregoryi]AFZ72538.1 hypothetical protein Natgr_1321 [Natronobacterium gregoryi SP2]ELY74148.1 hypothetical protein C490_00565 [Natronobacterium gregoryi SP2]PLK21507.1 DUF309 domain-containing protein [Natronobacterium gregoryi SP2]SFI76089.1 protein of unknown function [Natronobacterium gregoryi]